MMFALLQHTDYELKEIYKLLSCTLLQKIPLKLWTREQLAIDSLSVVPWTQTMVKDTFENFKNSMISS
jgi:hypothetical protein